jgi:hypothetical protein
LPGWVAVAVGVGVLAAGLELLPGVDVVDGAGVLDVGAGWELGCGVGEAEALGVLPPPGVPVPLEPGAGVPVPPEPGPCPLELLVGLAPAPEFAVLLGALGVVLVALGVVLADEAGALVVGVVDGGVVDCGEVGVGAGGVMGLVAVGSELEERSCCQSRCQLVKSV